VRTVEDAVLVDRLAKLANDFRGRLRVTLAISDGVPSLASLAGIERRDGECIDVDRGLVTDVAARALGQRDSGLGAYVAGPKPMVDAALRMLVGRLRIPPSRIAYDNF
jgi:toluene monooxygenase electron transfer component